MMKVHLGQSKDFLLVHCPFYQPISYYESKTSLLFVYVISFRYYVFRILYSSNLYVTFNEIGRGQNGICPFRRKQVAKCPYSETI